MVCKILPVNFCSIFISEYRKTYTGPKKAKDGELEKATAAS